MRYVFIAILSLTGLTAVGQDLEHENYNWNDAPVWTELDTSLTKHPEVTMEHNKIIEFAYSEDYNDKLVEYITIHERTRVLTDDAIQQNNKVYIGMGKVLKLVSAKARVITPENKVINFDESKILDSESEDEFETYKYFAIDGAVKGSDIEFIYTIIRIPSYNGIRNTFQDENPGLNTSFSLISPSNLQFTFKSYNGFPEVILDTAITEKNVYKANVDFIDALRDEDYAAYGKNLQHLLYKLDKNTATYSTNIISFGEISQNVYRFYRSDLEKKEIKTLKKLAAATEADKMESEEQKIWKIENYLKSEIMVIDGVPIKNIDEIISDGYTSEMGMTYLISHVLSEFGIKFEIVLTCDRFDAYFDEDFENYYILDNVMFYFPGIKKYMAPGDGTFRLGIVPSAWTSQKGLFIKEVSAGDIKTGMGKVKFIDPVPAEMTNDNMELNVSFDDMISPEIEFKRELSGYSCVYFQSLYKLIDEDGKKDLDEGLIKFADSKGEVISYELTGIEQSDFGINPMVYNGKIRSSSLIEKAGDRYLFKVGQLIGPQMEMYQEEERVLDIEHDHNMMYKRVITFEIPEGYDVTGFESLKINEQYPQDKPVIYFRSDYSIEGNQVTITVEEVYEQMLFDKSEIDEFRRIINAAANFNKATLFINKK